MGVILGERNQSAPAYENIYRGCDSQKKKPLLNRYSLLVPFEHNTCSVDFKNNLGPRYTELGPRSFSKPTFPLILSEKKSIT